MHLAFGDHAWRARHTTAAPKPDVVVPIIGIVVVAGGGADGGPIKGPGPAAQDLSDLSPPKGQTILAFYTPLGKNLATARQFSNYQLPDN